MKKKYRFLMLSFLALFLLALTACGKSSRKQNVYKKIQQTKTITWGVRADTRLFGLMSTKTGKIEGFEIDLAKALTKQMLGKKGKAKFVQTSPKTRIPLLRNGNIDIILATMTITPERQKQVDFTKPYFPAGQALLVPKNSKIKNIRQLNGKTVLAVKGTTAVENVAKFAPKAKVLEYDDYGQAFTALKAGQGQAMTTDNGILAGIAAENPGYKLVGGTFTHEPYGMAVDKGQPQLLEHLNSALNELKKDGTYQKISKKWFGNVAGIEY
ncbi:transporter substrate-binding domain-containing protein [Lactobacillus sp. PV037]|uniref:transporter substrate-binding domain-containing protein n=1 Tax=unclassified Lactobacillus TaxID=2620435 RepID=UPI002240646D|nr:MULTISPECIES: transporter substrate-binding domain-containing protein [unclassified Lactobacillus]QNQ82639.1 transporter substrate-binding domain-containing protein [Lactobacillus sp. PV012]QNQ83247.1 transporter substrate-binding domain-containing protein [Lactobacillus sp. PV037]